MAKQKEKPRKFDFVGVHRVRPAVLGAIDLEGARFHGRRMSSPGLRAFCVAGVNHTTYFMIVHPSRAIQLSLESSHPTETR
jgi:hypothetical protein